MIDTAFTTAQQALSYIINGKCRDDSEYQRCCKMLDSTCGFGGYSCVVVTIEAIEDGVCKPIGNKTITKRQEMSDNLGLYEKAPWWANPDLPAPKVTC